MRPPISVTRPRLPKDRLLGLVTEIGGRTSHVAIMARSL
ncbi:MAG TPA: hypothetical protein GXX69_09815, partial [Firmicutes bacterium]|nr:hypothetical protein [Bacillota bacterium]